VFRRIPRIHSELAADRDCFGERVLVALEPGFAAFGVRTDFAVREAETGAWRADFLPGVGIGRFIRRRFLRLLD
jgi:hypothetical protein